MVTSDPVPISGIRYVPLFSYEALLVVGARHPLLTKMRVEPVDLADQTLIIYPVDRSRLDVFTRFLDRQILSPHPFELPSSPL